LFTERRDNNRTEPLDGAFSGEPRHPCGCCYMDRVERVLAALCIETANSSRDCLSIDTYRMCDVVQPLTTCQETIASFTLLGFASAPRGLRQKLPHEVRNVCLRQRDEERPRKAALFGAQLTARSR
jgi:hypothetical protein